MGDKVFEKREEKNIRIGHKVAEVPEKNIRLIRKCTPVRPARNASSRSYLPNMHQVVNKTKNMLSRFVIFEKYLQLAKQLKLSDQARTASVGRVRRWVRGLHARVLLRLLRLLGAAPVALGATRPVDVATPTRESSSSDGTINNTHRNTQHAYLMFYSFHLCVSTTTFQIERYNSADESVAGKRCATGDNGYKIFEEVCRFQCAT